MQSQSDALDDYIERWRVGTLSMTCWRRWANKLSTENPSRDAPEQQTVPPRSVASPQTSSLAARLFGRRKPKKQERCGGGWTGQRSD